MPKYGVFTKILAIAGTGLLCFPLLAPVLLTAVAFVTRGRVLFDYLMPAELFPLVLLGGLLLLWAALRARSRRAWVAWGLGVAVVMLFGGQALAFFTGLATGRIEPEGWPWTLVLASLAVYALGIAAAGIGGFLLMGDLYKKTPPPPA